MNDEVKYRTTLDTLYAPQLRMVINMAEGGFVTNYFTWMILEACGVAVWDDGFYLTTYGRAFAEWYMQPRDVPQQLELL